MDCAVEGIDGAGDNHRGQAGMELFGSTNQLVAVHLRHDEIAKDEIQRAWEILIEDGQRFLCAAGSDDTIATGFEQEGADGENLFVVIYAENRLLGSHAVSLLPDTTFWWLAADGASPTCLLVCRHAGLVLFKTSPWLSRMRLFGA